LITVADDEDVKAGFDRSKSLQYLEHDDWGEPRFASQLVTTCRY